MRYYIIGIIILIIAFILFHKCDQKPIEIIKHDTIEILKEKVVIQEKEVIKLKDQKSKIIYITKFDTLATIDTVLVELIKCDSIVKIDSNIIAFQDTVITNQGLIIGNQEKEIEELNKDIKKEKIKNLISKIVAVTALVITYIIAKN